jgi:hypothetical protein
MSFTLFRPPFSEEDYQGACAPVFNSTANFAQAMQSPASTTTTMGNLGVSKITTDSLDNIDSISRRGSSAERKSGDFTSILMSLADGNRRSSQPPAPWVPDANAKNCFCCGDVFSFGNRKHHCRACGSVVCGTCSKNSEVVPSMGYSSPVRMCDSCYTSLRILCSGKNPTKIVAFANLYMCSKVYKHITRSKRETLEIIEDMLADGRLSDKRQIEYLTDHDKFVDLNPWAVMLQVGGKKVLENRSSSSAPSSPKAQKKSPAAPEASSAKILESPKFSIKNFPGASAADARPSEFDAPITLAKVPHNALSPKPPKPRPPLPDVRPHSAKNLASPKKGGPEKQLPSPPIDAKPRQEILGVTSQMFARASAHRAKTPENVASVSKPAGSAPIKHQKPPKPTPRNIHKLQDNDVDEAAPTSGTLKSMSKVPPLQSQNSSDMITTSLNSKPKPPKPSNPPRKAGTSSNSPEENEHHPNSASNSPKGKTKPRDSPSVSIKPTARDISDLPSKSHGINEDEKPPTIMKTSKQNHDEAKGVNRDRNNGFSSKTKTAETGGHSKSNSLPEDIGGMIADRVVGGRRDIDSKGGEDDLSFSNQTSEDDFTAESRPAVKPKPVIIKENVAKVKPDIPAKNIKVEELVIPPLRIMKSPEYRKQSAEAKPVVPPRVPVKTAVYHPPVINTKKMRASVEDSKLLSTIKVSSSVQSPVTTRNPKIEVKLYEDLEEEEEIQTPEKVVNKLFSLRLYGAVFFVKEPSYTMSTIMHRRLLIITPDSEIVLTGSLKTRTRK